MLKLKTPMLIASVILSFSAHCETSNDLQELLKSYPVSQADVSDLNALLNSDTVLVSPKQKETSKIETQVLIKENEPVSPVDKKMEAENDIAKTLSSEKVAERPVSGGDLFASNIPANSTIKFGNDLMLTTNGTAMFFKDGERVYSNPFAENKFATFCMFRFSPAKIGRRITTNNVFVVSGVGYKAFDKKMGLSADKHIQILKLNISNKDFKQIVCYSGSMIRPMTTGDMTKIIGNGYRMGIEQYKDI